MEDGELPWAPAIEERLRAAMRDIQFGTVTNWFELVKDSLNPVLNSGRTGCGRYQRGLPEWKNTKLRWLRIGHLIPHFYGLFHLPISSSPSLHPITDYVPGIVIEYIQGISMGSLQPGVDIPRPVAEDIADRVMDAFRTIKAEECDAQRHAHRQYSSARLGPITGPD
ncbi:uncharacterized protein ARMOST_15866 [Armillaria ostoyae]|uniref:Uncharacterized protein n=1 Tax=Armillaria ostoyae TaxID=47428 RepID=A0A284RUI8_ARMOS|nr:uncharacterized protein ARMOST_15866 [Armillaria ostoyae]